MQGETATQPTPTPGGARLTHRVREVQVTGRLPPSWPVIKRPRIDPGFHATPLPCKKGFYFATISSLRRVRRFEAVDTGHKIIERTNTATAR